MFEQSHCTKQNMVFKKHCVVPLNLNPSLLKGLVITGREGEDSQWPKTKEMYEVVLVQM